MEGMQTFSVIRDDKNIHIFIQNQPNYHLLICRVVRFEYYLLLS